jgi:hypothetical protein
MIGKELLRRDAEIVRGVGVDRRHG